MAENQPAFDVGIPAVYVPIHREVTAVCWTGFNRAEVEAFVGADLVSWAPAGNPLVKTARKVVEVELDGWIRRDAGLWIISSPSPEPCEFGWRPAP